MKLHEATPGTGTGTSTCRTVRYPVRVPYLVNMDRADRQPIVRNGKVTLGQFVPTASWSGDWNPRTVSDPPPVEAPGPVQGPPQTGISSTGRRQGNQSIYFCIRVFNLARLIGWPTSHDQALKTPNSSIIIPRGEMNWPIETTREQDNSSKLH